MTPDIRYTSADSVNIAYQELGDGPNDIILVPGWISNLETFWEEPVTVRFFQSLSEIGRLIMFDKRGTGLSDRVTLGATLEERMDDVRAVMDAVGSEKATLFGYSEGGAMSILFSTTYPERTRSLILMGSFARRISAPDYPFGFSVDEARQLFELIANGWGTELDIEKRVTSLADNPRFRKWWAKFMRTGASPAAAEQLQRMNTEIDVRSILPAISVPSLIMHSKGDQTVSMKHGEYLAEHIPGAQFVALDAEDHVPYGDCAEVVIEQIQQFLTGAAQDGQEDRVLKTIMFTDIVDSTKTASDMGDTAWRDLLHTHHELVRRELAIYRGEEVKTTGDGFHAVFDGPARGIKCAKSIARALEEIELPVRIGLHTGECVRRGADYEGQAIHIAARISGMASAAQILISQTVRDLIAGSGIDTEPRGTHQLKGIDGDWSICEVSR